MPTICTHIAHSLLLTAACSVLLAGCGGSSSTPDDATLREVVAAHGISGDPSAGRVLPTIDSPISGLGKLLFFSKSLGGEHDSACVSCHHPLLGGTDALSLSRGVGAVDPDLLGPGRMLTDESEGPNVPRNAPTTFNVGLWDSNLFWDGRVQSTGNTPLVNGDDGMGIRTPDSEFGTDDSLAGSNLPTAQSRFPVTSAEEMRGGFVSHLSNEGLRTALSTRLSELSAWRDLFASVFGDEQISFDRIAAAIGEYERSQVFVNTPWLAYLMGDNGALSASEKRGALLFYRTVEEGGANCVSCHSGNFFTDEKFHNIAVPQIGRGKGDGPTGDDDFGRFRESGDPADMYAFRTPGLINVAVTGPYGHGGAYTSLEGIVRHHLNAADAITNYDTSQLEPSILVENSASNTALALATLEQSRATGITPVLENVTLNDGQVQDLVSFLHALTDPCVQDSSCLAPWIPAPEEDADGVLELIFALQ